MATKCEFIKCGWIKEFTGPEAFKTATLEMPEEARTALDKAANKVFGFVPRKVVKNEAG